MEDLTVAIGVITDQPKSLDAGLPDRDRGAKTVI